MAEARFILKEPKGTKKTLVYLIYRFNNERLKYSTGEKILPKFWNPSKQRAKETRDFPEHSEFNASLNRFETAINNIYRKLQNDEITPTKESLSIGLDNYLKPKQDLEPKKIDLPKFFEFIDVYIEQVKNVRQKTTITVYKSTIKHLKAYELSHRKKLDFDNIDLNFYYDFIEYLGKQGIYNNTVGKYIKTLKSFLREAEAIKIQVCQDYKSPKFKVFTEEPDTIYLSEQELLDIHNFDFSMNKELDDTRDLFLIGAFTGLRFSDFTRIEKEHIQNLGKNKIIKIRTKKTAETVVVPVHWVVQEILEKHNYQLPGFITNDMMNLTLKEVGKALKLETNIIKNRRKGNQVIIERMQKFEQLTTHTARRSFATNAFLQGMPSIAIMKITGHKTEKSFLRYIRVSGEDNASLLAQHSFFSKK